MVPQHLFSLFLLHGICTAVPIAENEAIKKLNLRPRADNTVKTTVNADGSVLDWIPLHSQEINGNIASAPPLPVEALDASNQTTFQPMVPLQKPDAQLGPAGTVPILRQEAAAQQLVKAPPVDPEHMPEFKTEAAGDHWYASSAQGVNNLGGSASYSLYKAWTESSNDFSLLQSAVIRYNVPKPGANSQLVSQTVESGW